MIAVLLDASGTTDHPGLKKLTDLFKNVKSEGTRLVLTDPFDPASLFPGHNINYLSGDHTKCPRTECPGLKLTWIRVKVRVESGIKIMVSIRIVVGDHGDI